MGVLILGLVLFLGVHSVRIFADPWRTAVIARSGERLWKGAFAAASLAGFAVLIWGYGLARHPAVVLWTPPVWARHVTALLVLIAFVLFAAAYVPRNALKAWLHHPMVLGVKTWAVAHLLANGTLADWVLFVSFLAWSILSFRAARRRDRAAGTVYAAGTVAGTLAAIAAGAVAWVIFAIWLHGPLIGARPFG